MRARTNATEKKGQEVAEERASESPGSSRACAHDQRQVTGERGPEFRDRKVVEASQLLLPE